jgi:PBP1b-binding outer membrane lipoprotein LpoB
MMKAYPFALGMVLALIFAGCTTETTTTQSRTDQTTTRTHTQEELRKSGQSETGPALEQTDPAVRMSGPR